jgi:hypothetical protein
LKTSGAADVDVGLTVTTGDAVTVRLMETVMGTPPDPPGVMVSVPAYGVVLGASDAAPEGLNDTSTALSGLP